MQRESFQVLSTPQSPTADNYLQSLKGYTTGMLIRAVQKLEPLLSIRENTFQVTLEL